jgi:hypothetical protein
MCQHRQLAAILFIDIEGYSRASKTSWSFGTGTGKSFIKVMRSLMAALLNFMVRLPQYFSAHGRSSTLYLSHAAGFLSVAPGAGTDGITHRVIIITDDQVFGDGVSQR